MDALTLPYQTNTWSGVPHYLCPCGFDTLTLATMEAHQTAQHRNGLPVPFAAPQQADEAPQAHGAVLPDDVDEEAEV